MTFDINYRAMRDCPYVLSVSLDGDDPFDFCHSRKDYKWHMLLEHTWECLNFALAKVLFKLKPANNARKLQLNNLTVSWS